jgi:hypothetical protein
MCSEMSVNLHLKGIFKLSNLYEKLSDGTLFFVQNSNIKFYENSFIFYPVITSGQVDGLDAQHGRQDI